MKFDFNTVTRIVFGPGQISRLPELLAPLGSTALLVQNVGQELITRITTLLDDAHIEHALFAQVGEPKVADVDQALEAARQNDCDMVLGLGGGSAIDCAKAVAALMSNGGSAIDYMEVIGKGNKIAKPAAPWIAIPTTAGTGAEATRNAVIGHPEKRFKASIRSEHLLARIALVDPELAVGAPPEVTASSGMDALCQLIESYTSSGAEPITDALAIKGIALAARSLRRAFQSPSDIGARSDMALAALFSGIALANAGLGAVHGFAAPMGANFPIPHGVVCADLLPHVIRANIQALSAVVSDHPALARYAEIGRILMAQPNVPDPVALDGAIEYTTDLLRDLRMPPLSRFKFSERDIPDMVALARKASSMRYNPIVLSEDVLEDILRRAL